MDLLTLLYIRVSTGRQVEEGFSLDEQEKRLVNYCKDNGIGNYKVLIEAGLTGKNTNRPQYQQAVDIIKQGKVERIVMFKLDRMFRNTRDTLAFVDDVAKPNNVTMVSLHENLDTSTPQGRFMLTIFASVAELELGTMRLRMDSGVMGRAEKGLWHGGANVTYGYTYDKDQQMLLANEKAESVKQAFNLYISGHSTTEIATLLGFKYPDRVAKILQRPTYAGYIVHNGEVFKGKHKPLVSEEVFALAQQEIKARTWNRVGKHYYLLQNICHCGFCGAKLYYFPQPRRNHIYLRCYSQQNQQKYLKHSVDCPFYAKRVAEIEEGIIKELFALNYKVNEVEQIIEKEDILEKQKTAMTQKLSRLYDLYAENGNDVLKANIDSLLKDLEKLNAQIAQMTTTQQQAIKSQKTIEVINSIKTAWEHMTQQEKQQTVRALIDKIIIDNEKVTIYYNKYVDSQQVSFPVPQLLRHNKRIAVSRSSDFVEQRITRMLRVMSETPLSSQEIRRKLGIKSKTAILENYLKPAIERGLVGLTIHEEPRSYHQKYFKIKAD